MISVNTSDFGWNEIENKYYLVSYKQNKYFELNYVGRRIWEWAVSKKAFDDSEISCIVNALSEEYNKKASDIYDDVQAFLQSLKEIRALLEE